MVVLSSLHREPVQIASVGELSARPVRCFISPPCMSSNSSGIHAMHNVHTNFTRSTRTTRLRFFFRPLLFRADVHAQSKVRFPTCRRRVRRSRRSVDENRSNEPDCTRSNGCLIKLFRFCESSVLPQPCAEQPRCHAGRRSSVRKAMSLGRAEGSPCREESSAKSALFPIFCVPLSSESQWRATSRSNFVARETFSSGPREASERVKCFSFRSRRNPGRKDRRDCS